MLHDSILFKMYRSSNPVFNLKDLTPGLSFLMPINPEGVRSLLKTFIMDFKSHKSNQLNFNLRNLSLT